jgi:hypothetical protein
MFKPNVGAYVRESLHGVTTQNLQIVTVTAVRISYLASGEEPN